MPFQIKQFILSLLLFTQPTFAEDWLVWSEYDNDDLGMQIYLAQSNPIETTPLKLSQNGVNITPSLIVDHQNIWVIWVNRKLPENYQLHYAHINKQSLTISNAGIIPTFDHKIYSPDIIIHNNHPIITWSGFDGQDEEIRAAHFKQGSWHQLPDITQNNDSDAKPMLILLPNNQLAVQWTALSNSDSQIKTKNIQLAPSALRENAAVAHASVQFSLKNERKNMTTLPNAFKNRQSRLLMGKSSKTH